MTVESLVALRRFGSCERITILHLLHQQKRLTPGFCDHGRPFYVTFQFDGVQPPKSTVIATKNAIQLSMCLHLTMALKMDWEGRSTWT